MSVGINYSILRNAALFKNLSDDVLRELAQYCYYTQLIAGETLFEQNEPGDAIYVLEEGQIHIVRRYPSGEEIILATEGPYYVIGELSMLANQPRTGDVVAVSDCRLIGLERARFVEVCERMPVVAQQTLSHLGQRLYQMNLLVREHAIRNVAARVASALLLLCGGRNGVVENEIRLTRIARAVAIDADVVSRLLHKWQQQGYITFDGRRLEIHDVDTLETIAG